MPSSSRIRAGHRIVEGQAFGRNTRMRESCHQPGTLGAIAADIDPPTTDEPFAAVILCTAYRQKVDKRTRSKWSRVLRYAMAYKPVAEPLAAFIQRKGGINAMCCAICPPSWARQS